MTYETKYTDIFITNRIIGKILQFFKCISMCVDNIVSPIVRKLGNSIPGFYCVFLLHQLKKT